MATSPCDGSSAEEVQADPLETAIFFMSLSPDQLRPQIIARWRRFLKQRATDGDPVFGPWAELMKQPEADLAARAGAIVARWSSAPAGTDPGTLNPLVHAALTQASIRTRADVARAYGDLLRSAGKAPVTFSRAGFTGSQAHGAFWAGDD